jgi:capsular polysaccharide biosynthesis protein
MTIQLKKVSNAREWAESSGYEYLPLNAPEEVKRTRNGSTALYPCENIGHAKKIEDKIEVEEPILINGKNVYVILWNWINGTENFNYKYFIVSNTGEILCEPPNHSDTWHKYFPFFTNANETSVEIPKILIKQAEVVDSDNALTFCCGSSHFGHWMGDILPLILYSIIGQNSEENLLFTAFNSYQADVVQTIEKAAHLYTQHKKNYSYINIGSKQVHVFKFSKLNVFGALSTTRKTRLARHLLRAIIKPQDKSSTYNSAFYLYRGRVNGTLRLENENELVAILENLGIESVDSSKLSFSRAYDKFSSGRLFISSFGSGNTHYNLFAPDDANLIQLLPISYQHFTMEKCLGSAVYMLPRAENTRYIFCRQIDASSDSEHSVTHIDPSIILEVIRLFQSSNRNSS